MEHRNETGVAAVIKKPAKRGRWSAQQRQQIVDASVVAGASINEVGERFGIRANLMTAWRRRHAREIGAPKPESAPARFAAVQVGAVTANGTIEIDQTSRLVRCVGSLIPGCCARCWR
jgi:transposase-like protein